MKIHQIMEVTMNRRIKALCLSVLTVGMLAQNVPVNAGDDGGWLGFFVNQETIAAVATVVVACSWPVYKYHSLRSSARYFEVSNGNNNEVGSDWVNKEKERSLTEWAEDTYSTAEAIIAGKQQVKNAVIVEINKRDIKLPKSCIEKDTESKNTVYIKELIEFEKDKIVEAYNNLKSPWLLNSWFFSWGTFTKLEAYKNQLLKTDYSNKSLLELTAEEENGFYEKLTKEVLVRTGGWKSCFYPSFWLSSTAFGGKTEAEYYIDLTKKYHKIEALEKIYKGDTTRSTVQLSVCYDKKSTVSRQRRR